jgi:hypothetical protein
MAALTYGAAHAANPDAETPGYLVPESPETRSRAYSGVSLSAT